MNIRTVAVDIWPSHSIVHNLRLGRKTYFEPFTCQKSSQIIRKNVKRFAGPRGKTYRRDNQVRIIKYILISYMGDVVLCFSRLSIDEDDVSYIFEDLYRGRSAIPPHDVPNKPQLTRWNLSTPLSLDNCIVLDAPQLKRHVDGCDSGQNPSDIWGEEVMRIVERRSREARKWRDVFM